MLASIRIFVLTLVFGFIGFYIVLLLELNGTLPTTELSENVVKEVVSQMETK